MEVVFWGRRTRLTWLLAFVLVVTGLGAAEPESRFLEYAPAPVDNPLKGLVPYASAGLKRFPHSMEFMYFPLSALVVGKGKYDWEPLEKFLNGCAKRGNQAVFRVFLEYPGKNKVIPEHLVKGGLTVHKYLNTNTQPWPAQKVETPNYEDANLRRCLLQYISALGRRYDGDPRIGFITAGLLGTWGEWHTYPREDLWASKTVQEEVMAAYEAAFKVTPILLRYPAGPTHHMYVANGHRGFGFHDDSFTWATLASERPQDNWYFMAVLKAAGALEKWKTHPIGGEIRPEAWGQVFDERPTAPQIQSFERCVRETHASWVMDSGMFDKKTWTEARANKAAEQVRQMGYEFHVSKVTWALAGKTLSVAVTIENRGVAPFYYAWPAEYSLMAPAGDILLSSASSGKLDGLLPQTTRNWQDRIDVAEVPAGNHQLLLRVPNTLTTGKPLRFANRSQDQHLEGWLSLTSVLID